MNHIALIFWLRCIMCVEDDVDVEQLQNITKINKTGEEVEEKDAKLIIST